MIANRRRALTTSRKSSSRLPAISPNSFDRPVTLPPGRARLATRPVPTGSPAVPKTIGMTDVACFDAMTAAVPAVTMTSTLSWTTQPRFRQDARLSLCPAVLDCDRATFDPIVLAHALNKGGGPFVLGGRCLRAQEPDGRELCQRCARATRGQTAAPPRAAMKVRRLIQSPRRRGRAATAAR